MSVKPPNIRVRGLRAKGIPPGYILGRSSQGKGDVELLNLGQLRKFGVSTKGSAVHSVSRAGFGFNAQGLLNPGEVIGAGVWGFDITFSDTDDQTLATALIPASVARDFTFIGLDPSNIPSVVGGIHFAVGVPAGVVSWVGGSFLNLAGKPLQVVAPAVADASLADVTAIVSGFKS